MEVPFHTAWGLNCGTLLSTQKTTVIGYHKRLVPTPTKSQHPMQTCASLAQTHWLYCSVSCWEVSSKQKLTLYVFSHVQPRQARFSIQSYHQAAMAEGNLLNFDLITTRMALTWYQDTFLPNWSSNIFCSLLTVWEMDLMKCKFSRGQGSIHGTFRTLATVEHQGSLLIWK